MPNWIEGTLKLRGKPENVMRFFREGVDASSLGFLGNDKDDPESMVKEEKLEDGEYYYKFSHEPWVKGTRRAFITEEWTVWISEDKDYVVVPVAIKQAWAFVTENWQEIAKQYRLDIRLQGFECGMQFAQDLIIKSDGTVEKDEEIHYDNWDWDCPMPNMGG